MGRHGSPPPASRHRPRFDTQGDALTDLGGPAQGVADARAAADGIASARGPAKGTVRPMSVGMRGAYGWGRANGSGGGSGHTTSASPAGRGVPVA